MIDAAPPPPQLRRILWPYALSGFVSLGYQVAWFRIVTDWFGSTNLTFALVVANFIGGLAVGALASRPVARWLGTRLRLGEGLRVYGVIELCVSACVLLTFAMSWLPADAWSAFPYRESGGIWVQTWGYRAFQAAVASLCVFVPCFFMGATFPLLCDRFAAHPSGAQLPSALYAWNTLGACSGVLACQFLLLPSIGHDATLLAMAALNTALGAGFATVRHAWAGADPRRAAVAAPATADVAAAAPASSAALLALVTVGGFIAGALEGDLFKRVTFLIELNPGATMSFISFWAVLAIFLASAAVHRLSWLRLPAIRIAFALAALHVVLLWPHVDALRDAIERTVTPSPVEPGTVSLEGFRNLAFPTTLTQLLVFVGILVAPPYFLVSLLLPWACNELQRAGRHLGLAYGLNTLAFCVGLLGFVLIAPMVNVFYALKLFVVVLVAASAWLWLVRVGRPLPAWKPIALLAVIAAAILRVPSDFDPSFFRPESPPAREPVRAVKSDGANTTFVVDGDGMRRLFFGRLQMSATNLRARTYMGLMAHFPLLLHPDPKTALLICLGVGNTGAAIAAHDGIERIDIVDLNGKVFETLPEFAATNRDLHDDPRVRFIRDDGRNFLKLTRERYDLVTSEPPPPLAAGVYRLYSREYYQDVLDHLHPGGFMTQWLPLFLMTPDAVEMAISTFVDVFPHTLLFAGFGTDFVLLGSPSPIDAQALAARFGASRAVAEDLALYHIQDPASLLARVVQPDEVLRRRYGAAPRISDQRNDLEHLLPDPTRRPVIALEPRAVVDFARRAAPQWAPRVERIVTHLGRLRYHVQGYPFETLAGVDPQPGVALADVDWMRLGELAQQNAAALRDQGPAASARLLERFLEVSREQPEVLIQLAQWKLSVGRSGDAIRLLEELLALEPQDALGQQLLAEAYERADRPRDALDVYAQLAESRPERFVPHWRMAWILATDPDPSVRDPQRALAHAARADALAEGSPQVREALAAALAAEGRHDEAIRVVDDAIAALPEGRRGDRRRLIGQRERYRNGEALFED